MGAKLGAGESALSSGGWSRPKPLPKHHHGISGSWFLLSAMHLFCSSLGSKALPNEHLLMNQIYSSILCSSCKDKVMYFPQRVDSIKQQQQTNSKHQKGYFDFCRLKRLNSSYRIMVKYFEMCWTEISALCLKGRIWTTFVCFLLLICISVSMFWLHFNHKYSW